MCERTAKLPASVAGGQPGDPKSSGLSGRPLTQVCAAPSSPYQSSPLLRLLLSNDLDADSIDRGESPSLKGDKPMSTFSRSG